jgi:hypothetical protein
MARFSDDEMRRYSRQLVLAEVGGVGQERLRAATLRAADEVEALYLAAAGVGTIEVPSPAIADAVHALNPGVRAFVATSDSTAGNSAAGNSAAGNSAAGNSAAGNSAAENSAAGNSGARGIAAEPARSVDEAAWVAFSEIKRILAL